MIQRIVAIVKIFVMAIFVTCCVYHIAYGNAVSTQNMNVSPVGRLTWRQNIPSLHGQPALSMGETHRIFQTEDKALRAIDAQSGETIWRVEVLSLLPISEQISSKQNSHLMVYPPFSVGNIVLLAINRDNESRLWALDSEAGAVRWQFDSSYSPKNLPSQGPILSPPYVWRDRIIFRTQSGLTALKLSDGTVLWNVLMDKTIPIPSVSTEIPTSDSSIYFNSDYGVAYKFDPLTGQCIWSTRTHGMEIKSVINVKSEHFTIGHCQPMLIDKNLLISDGLGYIYELDAETGKVKWEIKPGNFTFQFVKFQGEVYAATDNGLLQLNLASGAVVKQYKAAGQVVRCIMFEDKAILTTFPNGWEVFSLQNWKQLYADPTFSPLIDVALDKNNLYLGGLAANSNSNGTEMRAYTLSSSSHQR